MVRERERESKFDVGDDFVLPDLLDHRQCALGQLEPAAVVTRQKHVSRTLREDVGL